MTGPTIVKLPHPKSLAIVAINPQSQASEVTKTGTKAEQSTQLSTLLILHPQFGLLGPDPSRPVAGDLGLLNEAFGGDSQRNF